MAQTLKFELVSPEKLLVSKDVTAVAVPGGEGVYGVLPGHAPMVTTIQAGVIETFTEEGGHAVDRIFVSGGFAEVSGTRCTVLADEAIPVAQLQRAEIESALRANGEVLRKTEEEGRAPLMAKQTILEAKLMAVAA